MPIFDLDMENQASPELDDSKNLHNIEKGTVFFRAHVWSELFMTFFTVFVYIGCNYVHCIKNVSTVF